VEEAVYLNSTCDFVEPVFSLMAQMEACDNDNANGCVNGGGEGIYCMSKKKILLIESAKGFIIKLLCIKIIK